MSFSTSITFTNFLNTIGYLLNSNKCPLLANTGGYPTCYNYETETFDYIIVGAGPAGCVLANRLSKNPDVKVLLIEAGDYPSAISEMPGEYLFLQKSKFDYNYTVQQSDFFKAYEDGIGLMSQGRGLGGGSSMNGMLDVPGVPYDYNKWADIVQDPEWAYEKLKPYFDKVSAMVQTTNYTAIRLLRLNLALAMIELGYSINDPEHIFGYHEVPIMVHEKTRNSMARAYLKPIANRSHLCVVVGKTVSKIFINRWTNTAMGVEVEDKDGRVYITARKEVIISAGAINSAKLLMLSGIGPKEHLGSLGIDVIKDLPVGLFLDHMYVPVYAQTSSIYGLSTHEEYIKSYCTLGFPMNDVDISNFMGWFNTKKEKTHPNIEIVHALYPTSDKVFLPHSIKVSGFTQLVAEQLLKANQAKGLLVFELSHLHPKSEGTILLRSSNPDSDPIIRGNYLNNPDDSNVLIDSIINVVLPILDTLPFALTNLIRITLPKCDGIPITGEYYKSRDYWACYLRHFVSPGLHPVATCRMGTNNSNSVVDTHFRIWGIQHLRIVDSGVIPTTLSGHPTVPVTMLAEKAADIILEDNAPMSLSIWP